MRHNTLKLPGLHRAGMPVLPTLLTLGNGVCGLASASYAAHAAPGQFWPLVAAGLLIFIAMIFDALDGGAARLLQQTSRFGAELESLCDAVSFGVAPALLLLRLGLDFDRRVLWAIAALYLVAALVRLARFNVDAETDDRHEWFTGLPSPAAGGMIAALAIASASGWSFLMPAAVTEWLGGRTGMLRVTSNAAPLIAVVLSGLMVSQVRYPHVVNQVVRRPRASWIVAGILLACLMVIAFGAWAAPLLLATFIVASPLFAAWQLRATETETDRPPSGFRRLVRRTPRGEDAVPEGRAKPGGLGVEKRSGEDRVRLAKSRKVRT